MALLSEVIPEEMAAKLEADGALPVTADVSEEVERSVWDRLQSVSTTRIADLLNNEQVQTSAAILNAMDREQASGVISLSEQAASKRDPAPHAGFATLVSNGDGTAGGNCKDRTAE